MIATLYTRIGDKDYVDKFDSHEEARKAYGATVEMAKTEKVIKAVILDLGGKDVTARSRKLGNLG